MQFDKLLSTVEAAGRLGVSSSYLNKLRVTGGGPPFVKIGARVAYDPADLVAWLAGQKRTTTGQAEPADSASGEVLQ